MSIFDGIKDKIRKAGEPEEDETQRNDGYDYDDETEEDDFADNSYYDDDDDSDSSFGSYDYDFGYDNDLSSGDNVFGSGRASESKSHKEGSNIYRMNSASASKINKVVFFKIEEVDDTRNIADCMISKDTVILADFSALHPDVIKMALYFIDGVRYISKSSIEKINNLYLIVPETIELTGDFFDQVNIGRISGK